MRAAGPQTHGYNLGSVQFDIAPSWSGKAKVYIPIAGWEIEAPIFSAPYAFHAQPRHVSPAAVERAAHGVRKTLKKAKSELKTAAIITAVRAFLFALLGALAAGAVVMLLLRSARLPVATGTARGRGVSRVRIRRCGHEWALAVAEPRPQGVQAGEGHPRKREGTDEQRRAVPERQEGELGHPGPLAPHRAQRSLEALASPQNPRQQDAGGRSWSQVGSPPAWCRAGIRWLGKSLRPPGRGRRTACSRSGDEAAAAPKRRGVERAAHDRKQGEPSHAAPHFEARRRNVLVRNHVTHQVQEKSERNRGGSRAHRGAADRSGRYVK